MKIELKKDELTVINLMRKSPAYCKFVIEKRPSSENPDGELSRIITETSTLLKDLIVVNTLEV